MYIGFKKSKSHFSKNLDKRPRLSPDLHPIRGNPGTFVLIPRKVAFPIFERPLISFIVLLAYNTSSLYYISKLNYTSILHYITSICCGILLKAAFGGFPFITS